MSPLLHVSNISKRFGGFVALDGIELEVQPGERVGLIGPNGSGKSTLVNCICGALQNEQGSVHFDGHAVDGLAAHQRTHRGLARSFQLPRPFVSLNLADNIRVPMLYTVHKRSGPLHADSVDARCVELLRLVGLDHKARQMPRDLTQVEMRKLELARAVAAEPKLLIADKSMPGTGFQRRGGGGRGADHHLRLAVPRGDHRAAVRRPAHPPRAVGPSSWPPGPPPRADASAGGHPPVGAPIDQRGHADRRVQVLAQRGRGAEARALGHPVHRQLGVLQEPPGQLDAPVGEPARGAHPRLVAEAAGERAHAHRGVCGEIGQAQRLGQPVERPRAGRGRRLPDEHRQRLDELRLPTLPPRRHHGAAGHTVGHGLAVVAAALSLSEDRLLFAVLRELPLARPPGVPDARALSPRRRERRTAFPARRPHRRSPGSISTCSTARTHPRLGARGYDSVCPRPKRGNRSCSGIRRRVTDAIADRTPLRGGLR